MDTGCRTNACIGLLQEQAIDTATPSTFWASRQERYLAAQKATGFLLRYGDMCPWLGDPAAQQDCVRAQTGSGSLIEGEVLQHFGAAGIKLL